MTAPTRCGYSGPVPGPITIPFDRTEFLVGLCAGLVGLSVGVVLARTWRFRAPLPVGGLLLGLAGALALWQAALRCRGLALPPGLLLGMAALVAGGLAGGILEGPRWTRSALVRAALVMPGAWLIAIRGELVEVGWIRVLVVVVIAVGGLLVADFDRRWRRSALGPVLVAVSAVGIFYTVPDTEEAMVFLGAALPIALLAWPWPVASLGTAGSFATVGFLCWTVVAAGLGRESSIVGGVACLGLLVVEPVARRLLEMGGTRWRSPTPRGRLGPRAVLLVAVGHLGLVYVASRVAGLRATVAEAAAIALVEGVMAVAFVAWLGARHARRFSGATAPE